MVVKATVDGSAVREAIAELKEIDPKIYNGLKRELRNDLSGLASGISQAWPEQGELSGLNGRGRTSYAKPRVTISVTPGKNARTLVAIKAIIPANQVGAKIAELAGMRGVVRVGDESRQYAGPLGEPKRHRLNGQGAYLIDRLNRRSPLAGRGGRYGWAYFVSQKNDVRDKGERILNRIIDVLNLEK